MTAEITRNRRSVDEAATDDRSGPECPAVKVHDIGDVELRLQNLEHQIEAIRERNARVETEKAWETSLFRVAWILLLTYICSALVFWLMESERFLLNALVPTLAFYLSTRSLPFVKRWWLKAHREGGR